MRSYSIHESAFDNYLSEDFDSEDFWDYLEENIEDKESWCYVWKVELLSNAAGEKVVVVRSDKDAITPVQPEEIEKLLLKYLLKGKKCR